MTKIRSIEKTESQNATEVVLAIVIASEAVGERSNLPTMHWRVRSSWLKLGLA